MHKGPDPKQQGSRNHKARLCERDVIDIKKMINETNYTAEYISTLFGVSRATIWRIKHNKGWKHVTD